MKKALIIFFGILMLILGSAIAIPFLFKEIGTTTVFAIFCIMMVFQLLWVFFKMPETKGVSLEEIQNKLIK